MYRLLNDFIVYRGLTQDKILSGLADVIRQFEIGFDTGSVYEDVLVAAIYEQINALLDVATEYGLGVRTIYWTV